jgi:hypothetical protein
MEMNFEVWQLIVGALGTLTGGGFLGNYLTKVQERKKAGEELEYARFKDQQTLAVEILSKQVDALEVKVNALEKLNEHLRTKLDEEERKSNLLQTTILMMQTTWDHFPFPVWFKDLNGYMRYFNRRYAEVFLLPNDMQPSEYLGKNDEQYWGDKLGKTYMVNDKKPVGVGSPWRGLEPVLISGQIKHWDVLKYTETNGRTPVGYRGIAFQEVPDYLVKIYNDEKNS